jgi:hypothetical protein
LSKGAEKVTVENVFYSAALLFHVFLARSGENFQMDFCVLAEMCDKSSCYVLLKKKGILG